MGPWIVVVRIEESWGRKWSKSRCGSTSAITPPTRYPYQGYSSPPPPITPYNSRSPPLHQHLLNNHHLISSIRHLYECSCLEPQPRVIFSVKRTLFENFQGFISYTNKIISVDRVFGHVLVYGLRSSWAYPL